MPADTDLRDSRGGHVGLVKENAPEVLFVGKHISLCGRTMSVECMCVCACLCVCTRAHVWGGCLAGKESAARVDHVNARQSVLTIEDSKAVQTQPRDVGEVPAQMWAKSRRRRS